MTKKRLYINRPPIDPLEQNKLAGEMLEWVANDAVFTLEDFPISKLMAPSRFYNCGENNEYFAQALDLARYTISSRLQRGLRNKTLDKDYVLRLLPLYNQEYKEIMLDKLKAGKEAPKTIKVVMEDYAKDKKV